LLKCEQLLSLETKKVLQVILLKRNSNGLLGRLNANTHEKHLGALLYILTHPVKDDWLLLSKKDEVQLRVLKCEELVLHQRNHHFLSRRRPVQYTLSPLCSAPIFRNLIYSICCPLQKDIDYIPMLLHNLEFFFF